MFKHYTILYKNEKPLKTKGPFYLECNSIDT